MIQSTSNLTTRATPTNNRSSSSQNCARLKPKEHSFNELNNALKPRTMNVFPMRFPKTFHLAVKYIKENPDSEVSDWGFHSLPDSIGYNAGVDTYLFNCLIINQKDNIINLYVVDQPTLSFAEEKIDTDTEHVNFGQLLNESINTQHSVVVALHDWINSSPTDEQRYAREKASDCILLCRNEKESTLDLRKTGINELPPFNLLNGLSHITKLDFSNNASST